MWVIKIGGSLLTDPRLAEWLRAITLVRREKVLIVPGGGVFADQAKEAYKESFLSEGTAHELAILAMRQYGYILSTSSSSIKIIDNLSNFNLHNGLCPTLWLPNSKSVMSLGTPESWDATSDSIAAKIAMKFKANLLLVKSHPIIFGSMRACEARRLRIVDHFFIQKKLYKNINVRLLDKSQARFYKYILNLKKCNIGMRIID